MRSALPIRFASILTSIVVVAGGLAMVFEARYSDVLARERDAVTAISRDATGLLLLAHEYAWRADPTVEQQWTVLHQRLLSTLSDAEGAFGKEFAAEVGDLKDTAIQLPQAFAALQAEDVTRTAPRADGNPSGRAALDRLINRTQRISDGALLARQGVSERRTSFDQAKRMAFGAALLLTALSAALLAWVVPRRIIAPLARLGNVAKSLAAGNLGPRTGVARRDEIGQLARDIDAMADAIQARESSLRQAVEEAHRADAAKSAFLATMSHEIRTPMNAVLGIAHVLDGMALGEAERQLLAKLRSAGQMLRLLLDDVLDLSKIEAGEMHLESARLRLEDLVWETVALYETQARQRGLDLRVEVDRSLPEWITGDAARLKQVLSNLLSNAVKFTEQGSIEVRARQVPLSQPSQWQLVVTDTGVGMDQAAQARLFKPFVQAEASTTRRYGGTGLGLSIVRSLSRLMGGDVATHSVPGCGSTFTVQLPIQAAEGPAAPARRVLNVLGLVGRIAGERPLADACRTLGWELEAADGPADFQARLDRRAQQRDLPDVIVLDWAAAGPAARHLLQVAQRTIALPSQSAALLVLATDAEGVRAQAPSLHPDDVLDRPADAAQLVDAVHASVRRRGGDADGVLQASTVRAAGVPLLAGARVLVVDDSPINLEVAATILRAEGAIVDLAENGTQALQRLHHAALTGESPDIVLMDVQMPDMDGLEVTRRIRRHAALPRRLPVLALTASTLKSERQQALDAGMDGFVTKPFEPHALVMLVRSQVERARGARLALVHPTVTAVQEPGRSADPDALGRKSPAGSDAALFARLLEELCIDHADLVAAADAGAAADDPALAMRLHRLGGSAGMLGARELCEAALRAEQDIRHGRANARQAMAQTSQALQAVTLAMQSTLAEKAGPRAALSPLVFQG